MADFDDAYDEETQKVMDLIIKLMEASSKNPVKDDRYMYYFSQRHGLEGAGIELKEEEPTVRRSDKDRLRRKPYSPKARFRAGLGKSL